MKTTYFNIEHHRNLFNNMLDEETKQENLKKKQLCSIKFSTSENKKQLHNEFST